MKSVAPSTVFKLNKGSNCYVKHFMGRKVGHFLQHEYWEYYWRLC